MKGPVLPEPPNDLGLHNGKVVFTSRGYHEKMLAAGALAKMDDWKQCEHGFTAPRYGCVRCIVKVEAERQELLAEGKLAVLDIP